MSLTNQPAVLVHVLLEFHWDVALIVYVAVMAGSGVFGTDVPYEAVGIDYHLYVDGMPMLPIAVYVLCLTGGLECHMCAINGPHGAWESGNSVEICHCLQSQVLLGGFDDLVGHASENCRDNLVHTSAHGGL